MAINSRGEIVHSVYDDCTNYKPDKNRPSNVKCVKYGQLFECLNFAEKNKKEEEHCTNCLNRKEL